MGFHPLSGLKPTMTVTHKNCQHFVLAPFSAEQQSKPWEGGETHSLCWHLRLEAVHLLLQSYPQHDDEGAEYPGWSSAIWAEEPKLQQGG